MHKHKSMVLCKKCGNRLKIKLNKDYIPCRYCIAVVDFQEFPKINRIRLFFFILNIISAAVFGFISAWFSFNASFSELMVAALIAIPIAVACDTVLYLASHRIIVKMHDDELRKRGEYPDS